jgi:hypothetical protein
VGCEAPRFQVFFEGKARPTRHSSVFFTGMVLFSPSMMDSLFYEPNVSSVMLRFCVFLRFFTVCTYGAMALCDDCKMLVVVSKEMGIIEYKGCTLFIYGSAWFLLVVLRGIMKTMMP